MIRNAEEYTQAAKDFVKVLTSQYPTISGEFLRTMEAKAPGGIIRRNIAAMRRAKERDERKLLAIA
jgi:hypothetical protein